MPLAVPALRERRDDVPDLVRHFLGQARARYRREVREVAPAAMVVLFTLPAIIGLIAGQQDPATQWANRALSVWVVPPAVMFLLFAIRSADTPGAGLLTWKDAEQHSPWGVILLVTGAVAMTDALAQFGFVEFMGGVVNGLGIGPTALPYLAALIVAVTTNFFSGTAAAGGYSCTCDAVQVTLIQGDIGAGPVASDFCCFAR